MAIPSKQSWVLHFVIVLSSATLANATMAKGAIFALFFSAHAASATMFETALQKSIEIGESPSVVAFPLVAVTAGVIVSIVLGTLGAKHAAPPSAGRRRALPFSACAVG